MGLREQNASRTRRVLARAAAELYTTQGYEETSIEDVARHADVSTSTLYRYFPTKEALFAGFLGEPGVLARALLARPEDEPVEESLGEAVVQFLTNALQDSAGNQDVLATVEAHPRLQAQLLNWLHAEQEALADALGERLGLPASDMVVASTSWLTIFALRRISDEHTRRLPRAPEMAEIAVEVMNELANTQLLLPTFSTAEQ